MSWRLADSLLQLKSEINACWPKRDRSSDGSIGDQSHANRDSDHNPNRWGVVTAHDFDDDFDPDDTIPFRIAEHLRNLGRAGFKPLQNGGYIIYYRKICSARDNWAWRDYNGINAHKTHIHVSAGNSPSEFDNTSQWMIRNILNGKPVQPQPQSIPHPVAKDDKMYILIKGDSSPEIWLTDGVTKRQMKDQNEINFMAMALAGNLKARPDGLPEVWPQEYVDRIGRSDANEVDATFRWWAASPEENPFEEVINDVLTKREAAAASTKSSSKGTKST